MPANLTLSVLRSAELKLLRPITDLELLAAAALLEVLGGLAAKRSPRPDVKDNRRNVLDAAASFRAAAHRGRVPGEVPRPTPKRRTIQHRDRMVRRRVEEALETMREALGRPPSDDELSTARLIASQFISGVVSGGDPNFNAALTSIVNELCPPELPLTSGESFAKERERRRSRTERRKAYEEELVEFRRQVEANTAARAERKRLERASSAQFIPPRPEHFGLSETEAHSVAGMVVEMSNWPARLGLTNPGRVVPNMHGDALPN